MSNEELVQLYQNGDKKALEKLIQANTGIINKIANKYNGINRELEFNDLFQSGVLGLIKAVEKYNSNHEKKAKFITYAIFLIDRYIYGVAKKHNNNKKINNKEIDKLISNFSMIYKSWFSSFYGVATKYLKEYFCWLIIFNLRKKFTNISFFKELLLGDFFVKVEDIGLV